MNNRLLTVLVCLLNPAIVSARPQKPANLEKTKAEEVPFAKPGQAKERAKQSEEERVVEALTKYTNREIDRLRDFTKLDDAAITDLKLGLKPLIAKTAKAHPGLLQPRIPPSAILDAIAQSAKTAVTDQDALAKYLEDMASRRAFAEQMAMQTYVYYIDSLVGLNNDQWEAVRQAGGQLHRQGDLSPMMLTYRDHQVPKADLRELIEILTEKQLRDLKKFTPLWRGGREAENLTRGLRDVAEMKVQQLDEIVQLSPAQRQRVAFVSQKTMIPNVVRRRMIARKILLNFGEIMKNPDDEPLLKEMSITEAMNISTARLPHLFADERWQKFVTATLTDQQAKNWQRFIDQRTDAAIDAQAAKLIRYFSEINLTGSQQLAAHQLFRKAVKSQGAKLENSFSLVTKAGILSVLTQQEIEETIGKENWPQVDEVVRKQFSIGQKNDKDAVNEN